MKISLTTLYCFNCLLVIANITESNILCTHFCCEGTRLRSRLIQVAYVTSRVACAESQPHLRFFDVNMFVCQYVYHRICLDFKYGPRNRGSFVRSQSIQKEKQKSTQHPNKVWCATPSKPRRNPVSYRKPRFCKRRVSLQVKPKTFPWIEAIGFLEYFKQFLEAYGK